MTRRPIIGRKARARWGGKCPQCGAEFAAGAILYRVAAARNAWCAVPCRGSADAPRPTAYPPGLDGTVRWADPLTMAGEIPPDRQRTHVPGTASPEEYGDAVQRIRNGDLRPAVLDAIERGREKGRAMAQPKAERLRWELDAVGALPSVPHYLSGCERTMLRPAMHASESAPVTIWASVDCGQSVTEEQQIERGGVLAGILEAISAVRPVRLVLFALSHDSSGTCAIAWEVGIRDGSVLAAHLGQAVGRGIILRWQYAVHNHHAMKLAWPEEKPGKRERDTFGIPEGDLLVRAHVPSRSMGTAETDLAEFLAS